jgi:ribonuclease HI
VSHLRAANFEELAQSLNVSDFDIMIVSDGAGNLKDTSCGWVSFVFNRPLGTITRHVGATSAGTNNYAELAPFLHAFWHINAGLSGPASFKIVCVTDSELTVKQGIGQYARNANAAQWAAVDWYTRNGYRLDWQWVARNSNPINAACDAGAKDARRLMETARGVAR